MSDATALRAALADPARVDAAARILCPMAFQVHDENTANDVRVGPVTRLLMANARQKVRDVVEALTEPRST